jgi:hypothetical protein
MADGVSVEVRGVAELVAGSKQLADKIAAGAGDAFLGVADQAAQITRGRLHVDTGATAASVYAERSREGARVGMGDGVPYAQYEEYGGRGWPHSVTGNFLYPSAYTDGRPLVIAAAERDAEKQIGEMNWPTP